MIMYRVQCGDGFADFANLPTKVVPMKIRITIKLFIIAILFPFLLTGCMALKSAPPKATGMQITIMPIVDLRKDRSQPIDSGIINNTAQRMLVYQGYEVDVADSFGEKASRDIDAQHVLAMDIDKLCELGPKGSENLLFIYLHDIDITNSLITKNIKVELSAMVLQTIPPKVLWRDKKVSFYGTNVFDVAFQGVVTTAVSNALYVDAKAAVTLATQQMFKKLPNIAK
jgi:hypothetical protein